METTPFNLDITRQQKLTTDKTTLPVVMVNNSNIISPILWPWSLCSFGDHAILNTSAVVGGTLHASFGVSAFDSQ